jgi:antitoxin PrlF
LWPLSLAWLEADEQARSGCLSQTLQRPHGRARPAAFQTRDDGLRRPHLPGQLLLREICAGAGGQVDSDGRNSYNHCMKTIVSEKGQITIPKPLRVRLGIRKGEVLDVREERGRLVMSKRPSNDPFAKYFGILKLGRRTDDIMKELRGEYPLK